MNSPSACPLIQTPVRHFSINCSQEPELELPYLEHIQSQVVTIALSLRRQNSEQERRTVEKQQFYLSRLREQQNMMQSLASRNEQLESENSQLKLAASQSMRYVKRYEMKLQLLVNKISHLDKIISEKEAIIKYLENKSQETNRCGSKAMNYNDSTRPLEELNTYRKNDLSFAKVKQDHPLTFQSFTAAGTRITPPSLKLHPDFKPRDRRIRTESNDIKESFAKQNMRSSQNKLQEMLGSKQWNNEKTLTKNRNMSTSCFWRQGSLKLSDTLNKSINANSSTFFRDCFYERELTLNELHSKR